MKGQHVSASRWTLLIHELKISSCGHHTMAFLKTEESHAPMSTRYKMWLRFLALDHVKVRSRRGGLCISITWLTCTIYLLDTPTHKTDTMMLCCLWAQGIHLVYIRGYKPQYFMKEPTPSSKPKARKSCGTATGGARCTKRARSRS